MKPHMLVMFDLTEQIAMELFQDEQVVESEEINRQTKKVEALWVVVAMLAILYNFN